MATQPSGGFQCLHCHKIVPVNDFIGTKNRNHCPFCLWSKHVDDRIAGDRNSACGGGMQPVGLTYKQVGQDKYGQARQGELMIIHRCSRCRKISINRIAADDNSHKLIDLLDPPVLSEADRQKLSQDNITALDQSHSCQVKTLLFGKPLT